MADMVAIDTLRIYERLKNAGLPEPAANEIATIFLELRLREEEESPARAASGAQDLSGEAEIGMAEYSFRKVGDSLAAETHQSTMSVIGWIAIMLLVQAWLIVAIVKLL